MNPPRPHLGRLTVAAALVAALPVAVLAWSGGGSADGRPDGATNAAPAALAHAAASTTSATSPAPAAPSSSAPQPKTLGDDPMLDDLWHRCEQGSGAVCDQLFEQAPLNSDYESFGLSCGNRPDVLRCTQEMDQVSTTVPPPTLPVPLPVPPTPTPVPTTTPVPTSAPAPAGEAAAAVTTTSPG